MRSVDLLYSPLEELTFSVVDTETTGMNAIYNRIMDIGIVTMKNGEITDTWETLINPKQQFSEWITYYTNLTYGHVKHMPDFDHFAVEIFDRLKDTVFVAHNAGFDYSFVSEEFKRSKISFESPRLCTVLLGRKLLPELTNVHLDALSDFYDIKISQRHRALPDAQATAIVLQKFIELGKQRYNIKTLSDLIRLQHMKISRSFNENTKGLFEL